MCRVNSQETGLSFYMSDASYGVWPYTGLGVLWRLCKLIHHG